MITKKMNIAVAGTGYVGLSLATLLAQKHHVTALDIVEEKVKMINDRISPIQDECIRDFFEEKELDLVATVDPASAYRLFFSKEDPAHRSYIDSFRMGGR